MNGYKKIAVIETAKTNIAIILSKNDTIVNPKLILEKYNDFIGIKFIEGDYKLTQFESLIVEIQKIKESKKPI